MNYTVKQIANLSGVSVRTLHYYDEIGLLKPTFVSETGYRYYQEPELLRLQQILFFKELGFELAQIKEILDQPDFDRLSAMQEHKNQLNDKIKRLIRLTQTIDKTITHLLEKEKMNDQELYVGFSPEKQAEYERYLIKRLGPNRKEFLQCRQAVAQWNKKDWQHVKQMFEDIHQKLAQPIGDGLKPESSDVQQLIEEHFKLISKFWTPTKESYTWLGQLYLDHPDFVNMYVSYHPKLANYLAQAMEIYAEKNLS